MRCARIKIKRKHEACVCAYMYGDGNDDGVSLPLHRLSKFESRVSIQKIGNWVAVHNPGSRLEVACRHVDGEHAFPLLCVIDVALKFSEHCQKEIGSQIFGWLQILPAIPDARMRLAAASLILNWIHHGAVDAICNTAATKFMGTEIREGGAAAARQYACPVCRVRFASPSICAAHVRVHYESTQRALLQQQTFALGLFVAIEEKQKTERALRSEIPTRVSSPLAIIASDGEAEVPATKLCGVCGDALLKVFSDVHNTFMWDGCRRVMDAAAADADNSAALLMHDGCSEYYCPSSRPIKKWRGI